MSRYRKVLNSKAVGIGLLLLAGYLLASEGLLWREKLAKNDPSVTGSAGQLRDAVRLSAGEANAETVADASVLPLENLTVMGSFEQVSNVPEGTFEYGGSTTWAPIRKDIDADIQAMHPEFQLQYTSPNPESGRTAGSGTGIQMLLDGELLFSQSSRPLKENEIAEAQRNGYSLQQVAVAIDGIAIAVHPDLEIPGLTMTQLRDIYMGRIRNWQEVGGPDVEIVPYSRRIEDSGTAEFFVKTVLNGAQLGANTQFAASTTAGVRQVSTDIGSIYYASAPEIVGQCGVRPLSIAKDGGAFVPPYVSPYVKSSECPRYRNQLNTEQFQNGEYPITHELFVIVKQNGQLEEQVGVTYANFLLTDEGQDLIESIGFVGTGN